MTSHRVVITGLGTVSALGQNYLAFWDALSSAKSGVSSIQQVDCSAMRFHCGAEVKGFQGSDYFSDKELVWLDRFAQFALVATAEAIKDADFSHHEIANVNTAVITGSCIGGKQTEEQNYYRLYRDNKTSFHPNVIPNSMANAAASHIAATYGITGPAYNLSTACASSTHAIGQAFWLIQQGVVQRAITGGSESPFSYGHLRAWESLRVVTSDLCRPFSKNRTGMILGEGGAILILESLDSALKREATIHAEIVGFGMSADAAHLTNPNADGQCQAIHAALHHANLPPDAIRYYNAHGTGTALNDSIESTTINKMFPQAKQHLLVSSTKAAHGHLLGATGAIETIATVLALKHQIIPPTLNYSVSDPACDLPLVVNHSQSCDIDYAMNASFAFGGLNAALVLRHFHS